MKIGRRQAESTMVRYQTQAVLRRTTRTAPLVLVGITLDNTFFARGPDDVRGRFVLTKGLVALAPLDAVEATGPEQAAVIAMLDAATTWNGPHSPGLAHDRGQP